MSLSDDMNDDEYVSRKQNPHMRSPADTINEYVAQLEERVKKAEIIARSANKSRERAVEEARKWHEMYERASRPEIRLVAGDDQDTARTYVEMQDRKDELEDLLVKAYSRKDIAIRDARRANAYILGIRQRALGVPVDAMSNACRKEVDIDRKRREGWFDMDSGFSNYKRHGRNVVTKIT